MNSLYTFSFENGDLSKIKSQNCENFIGSVEVPVGVAGPVAVIFKKEKKEVEENWKIPLATTEGALVASVNRGCKVLRLAGGAKVSVKKIGMTRAPVFEANDGWSAGNFCDWLDENFSKIAQVCESTSSHLKLLSFQSWVRGRNAYVRFVFDTDEAMGMNMVTIALGELWRNFLSKDEQLKKWGIKLLSISSNLCTDKKDSAMNRILGRGYSVQVEATISEKIIQDNLHTTSDDLIKTHHAKNLVGSNLAGSFSQNMQVANVVAAMFLATGQDVAHVVEASQATVNFEKTNTGLYVSLNLPNINVGSIGGGCWFPAQTQARLLIRDGKKISAQQLAVAVGVGALAGEISGLSALCSHSLASAHQKLGRAKK